MANYVDSNLLPGETIEFRTRLHPIVLAAPALVFVLVIVTMIILSGCGCVTMSPGAQQIMVTSNPDLIRGCKFMQQIKGHSKFNGQTFMADLSENNATAELANGAAWIGADTIYIERIKASYWSGTTVTGDAYLCKAKP